MELTYYCHQSHLVTNSENFEKKKAIPFGFIVGSAVVMDIWHFGDIGDLEICSFDSGVGLVALDVSFSHCDLATNFDSGVSRTAFSSDLDSNFDSGVGSVAFDASFSFCDLASNFDFNADLTNGPHVSFFITGVFDSKAFLRILYVCFFGLDVSLFDSGANLSDLGVDFLMLGFAFSDLDDSEIASDSSVSGLDANFKALSCESDVDFTKFDDTDSSFSD